MKGEPLSTINSPIYRSIAETLNKTLFEVYVTESYRPVVHSYYLEHPEIPPINAPAPFEMDNLCKSRLPIVNIIDLIATGQHFRMKYMSDIPKIEAYLKSYIDSFDGISLEHAPQQKAFLEKVKLAYDSFKGKHRKHDDMKPAPKKKLSLVERIRMLAMGA